MSLPAQLVDIKPPLKFLLLIFPSLCNSRVCNEKVFSCYHTPYRQSRLLGSILDSSGIYQGSIMEPFQSHPGTIQDPNLYTQAMNLVVLLLLQTGSSCMYVLQLAAGIVGWVGLFSSCAFFLDVCLHHLFSSVELQRRQQKSIQLASQLAFLCCLLLLSTLCAPWELRLPNQLL